MGFYMKCKVENNCDLQSVFYLQFLFRFVIYIFSFIVYVFFINQKFCLYYGYDILFVSELLILWLNLGIVKKFDCIDS